MVLQLTEDDIHNPDILGEKLIQLAEIIVRKHFYASLKDKEDLVSVGVLKALQLIDGNSWTKQRGSFLNYIYSGMRNDMHNYLYHQNKFSIVDIDAMLEVPSERSIEENYVAEEACDMEYGLIHSVCINFTDTFGNDIERQVLQKIKEMGFSIKGMRGDMFGTESHIYCNPILREQYGKDVEEDIIGRIIGLILWKKKDREYM